MTNIGEELTSIYLRVNGFLQLSNFVIHRTEDNERGECDILALRLLNMKETIYFRDKPEIVSSFDYSNEVLGHKILDLAKDIYLWIEVTLRDKVAQKYVEGKFSNSKCKYVIERLGIQDWVDTDHLSSNSFYVKPTNDKVFAKILVTGKTLEEKSDKVVYANLDWVKTQLLDWFRKYSEIKGRDWNVWVNPFLQGLAKQII